MFLIKIPSLHSSQHFPLIIKIIAKEKKQINQLQNGFNKNLFFF